MKVEMVCKRRVWFLQDECSKLQEFKEARGGEKERDSDLVIAAAHDALPPWPG